MLPKVQCPKCHTEAELDQVLTAQSNQNVIYRCQNCSYECRDIHTSKG
ncbi:hypothetical protein ACQCT6_06605 [Cytobacillus gottheilii]|nr:hypothetical protein [Cytobacillus gottheilii]